MAKSITIKLEPYGLANEWVRIRDPKMMSWGEVKEITATYSGRASAEQVDALYMRVVEEWDVNSTDNPPEHFTGAPTPERLQRVPYAVLEAVVLRVKQRVEAPPGPPA